MQTIDEYRKSSYDYNSGKASELTRQFAFAGIAIIWIFRNQTNSAPIIPYNLIWPALFIFVSLLCDFLHYVSAALIWGIYLRYKEKHKQPPDKKFKVPAQMNWPAICFYYIKIASLIVAYVLIIEFLISKL